MPRPVARLGDRTEGTCAVHGRQGGTIITASTDVSINQRGIARLNDQVEADCGHIAYIITGSDDVPTNQRPTARLNDQVGNSPYEAIIISGSEDTNLN